MNSEERDMVYERRIYETDMIFKEINGLTKALLKWRRTKGAEPNDIIDELKAIRAMCRWMEILLQAEDDETRNLENRRNK